MRLVYSLSTCIYFLLHAFSTVAMIENAKNRYGFIYDPAMPMQVTQPYTVAYVPDCQEPTIAQNKQLPLGPLMVITGATSLTVAAVGSGPCLNAVGATVAAFGATYILDIYKKWINTSSKALCAPAEITLLDGLLSNPLRTLYYVNAIHHQCDLAFEESHLDQLPIAVALSKYKNIITHYQKLCPFFLLFECFTPADSCLDDLSDCLPVCTLNRREKNCYRAVYEKKVVDNLYQRLEQNGSKKISLAIFGAGGLYQDLVILTKLLAKKPTAHIDMHIIDKGYVFYTNSCNTVARKKNPKIDIYSPEHMLLGEKIEEYYKKKDLYNNKDLIPAYHYIQLQSLRLECHAKQYLTWLTTTFPGAQLSLSVYSDTKSFMQYLNDTKSAYPDLLTAADIEDESSVAQNAIADYVNLCVKTTQKNNNARNIWLSKYNRLLEIDDNNKGHILSLYLNKRQEKANHILPLYKTVTGQPIYIADTSL